jgi:integrase
MRTYIARDQNILPVIRRGEQLLFDDWVDFFLEHYSRPPIREAGTHEANVTALKRLRPVFGAKKLSEITGDDIESYLWIRLREHRVVRRKSGPRKLGMIKPTTVHQEFRVLRRVLNVAVKKKLCPVNPCASVEFPVALKGLFRPHYMSWSEQQRIEFFARDYLKNVIRIITETGLRVYKELAPMRKDQVNVENAVIWVPDSKTPNGVAEVPLTPIALEAFKDQIEISGQSPWLFPNDRNPAGHQGSFKKAWEVALRKAGVPYFRIYDLRSTYATVVFGRRGG